MAVMIHRNSFHVLVYCWVKDHADRIRYEALRFLVVMMSGEYASDAPGKVKHLYVNEDLYKALSDGRVALVGDTETVAMVPSAVAEKIRQRDETKVLLLNAKGEDTPVDDDDPYADFQVPDDLMW